MQEPRLSIELLAYRLCWDLAPLRSELAAHGPPPYSPLERRAEVVSAVATFAPVDAALHARAVALFRERVAEMEAVGPAGALLCNLAGRCALAARPKRK